MNTPIAHSSQLSNGHVHTPSSLGARLTDIWGDGPIRGVAYRTRDGFASRKIGDASELLGINRDTHVCFIHPHDDDPVLGAGFLMMDLYKAGHRLSMIQVTDGSLGWANRNDADTIVQDRYAATVESARAFGIDTDNDIRLLNFPDGSLSRHAGITFEPGAPEEELTGLLPKLVIALRDLRPDVIVFTSKSDVHPDHKAVSREVPWAIVQASEGIWTNLGERIPFPKVFEYAVYSSLGAPQDGEIHLYHPRGVDFTMAAMGPYLGSQEAQISGILGHLSRAFDTNKQLKYGNFQRLLPVQPVERANVTREVEAVRFTDLVIPRTPRSGSNG